MMRTACRAGAWLLHVQGKHYEPYGPVSMQTCPLALMQVLCAGPGYAASLPAGTMQGATPPAQAVSAAGAMAPSSLPASGTTVSQPLGASPPAGPALFGPGTPRFGPAQAPAPAPTTEGSLGQYSQGLGYGYLSSASYSATRAGAMVLYGVC